MKKAYQLTNVIKRYSGKEALNISSLSFSLNQSTAILGENGAGKSTLIQLLAFTLAPSQGEIHMLEQHTSFKLTQQQRQQIGLVTQAPFMLHGTVSENIKLALKLQNIPKHQHNELIASSLEITDLLALADRNVNQLSGGELKRAALARAISYQPDIILLDEPFAHLDQRHIRLLENTIRTIAAMPNKTVIFSTHDRVQAMGIAQHAVNLVNGRISHAPLLNFFHGKYHHGVFDTGRIKIHTSIDNIAAQNIAIDPKEVIISETALHHSSLINSIQGRLVQISEHEEQFRLQIDCGELIHVFISPASLHHLALHTGDTVWVNFQDNAINLF